MRYLQPKTIYLSIALAGALAACSGEQAPEKAILGTWVQETPFSMTDSGLQTTTADTVLRLKKNGETHLTRNLTIEGQGLPESGILVNVELRGSWDLVEGQLRQTPDTILIIPRNTDDITRNWADKLQTQAESAPPSVKTIISASKKQLILQDTSTGTTDVYNRK